MGTIIRPATLEDVASINSLTHQLGYPITENDTRFNLESILKNLDEVVYVAEAEEKIVGWIHVFIAIRLESGRFAELGGLVVDENYRGMKTGRELVGAVADWCRKKNISILKLRSNLIRSDAHRFYTSLGFIEIKKQKVFEKHL